MPGLYDLSIESLRSTWMLRSAVAGGQDLLDSLVEFVTADIADMVVTLSDRRSEVSGVVLDQANQPASDCSVVVFPSDRQLWRSIRRVKTMRPATNGRFRVSPLPAGEYLIAAIKDIEPQQLRNVGLLEQLASTAIRLSVAEGSGHVQDLRIVR